jgi:hypothetical protein
MAKTRIVFEHESDSKNSKKPSGSVVLGFALAIGLVALVYFIVEHPDKVIEFVVKAAVSAIRQSYAPIQWAECVHFPRCLILCETSSQRP